MGNGHPEHIQGTLSGMADPGTSPRDLVGIRDQWVLPTLASNAWLSSLQLLQLSSPDPFSGAAGIQAQTQLGRAGVWESSSLPRLFKLMAGGCVLSREKKG